MAVPDGLLTAAVALIELVALAIPALAILLYGATEITSSAADPVVFAMGYLAIAGFIGAGVFVLAYLVVALDPPSLLMVGFLLALVSLAATAVLALLLYRASRSRVSHRLSESFR